MTAILPSTRPSRVCSPRYATRRRPERPTYGGEIAKIARSLGQPMMPWQRMVADVAGEYDPETGIPYYREIVVTVPRQSGKTTLFLGFQCHRCLAPRWEHPQRSAFTAQTGKDARDKWLDELFPALRKSKLSPLIKQISEGMGNEAVRFKNGSLIRILSSSNSSGHSKTLHQATLDELWHDVDSRREQGLRPAMITVPDAQLLVCSTAGTELSVVLQRKVRAGRKAVKADTGRGVAYFEYSAPDDWDMYDDESFYSFHPALCPDPPCTCGDGEWRHTITIDVLRSERDGMSETPDEFKRAYGNIEIPGTAEVSPIPGSWSDLVDTKSKRPERPALAVGISPDQSMAAIGTAGRSPDGRMHVDVLEHRAGTDWVIDRIVELTRDIGSCVLTLRRGGQAASLIPDLQENGFHTKPEKHQHQLQILGRNDYAQACGAFVDDITAADLRHRNRPELNDATEGVRTKTIEDAYVWSLPDSLLDILPLEVVTLARHGYATYGVVKPKKRKAKFAFV